MCNVLMTDSHLSFREMIASLNICAAVHGTVDDNMAVHGKGDESGDQEGERETGMNPPLRYYLSVCSLCSECQGLLHYWRHEILAELARRSNFSLPPAAHRF